MMQRRKNNRSGFTLLEALLAVGIFAGSMGMVVQLMRGTARITLRGNLEVTAAERCQSLIDEILASSESVNVVQIANDWSSDGWIANLRIVRTEWPGIVCIHAVTEYAEAPELSRFEMTRLVSENRIGNQSEVSSLDRGGQ